MKIKMKIRKSDALFLIYFVPIFFIKLLNYTAADTVLKIATILAFSIYFTYTIITEQISKKEFWVYLIIIAVCAILMFTSGKEGAFFSTIALFAIRNVDYKKTYPILISVALLAVIIYVIRIGDAGRTVVRYINGTWESVFKRSNIIFVSYFALLSLVLLYKRNCVNSCELTIGALLSFGLYKYSMNRSGFLCALLLIGLILIFKSPKIRKNKLVKNLCWLSPIICFLLSFLLSFFYGRFRFITILDHILQGRFAQGHAFLNAYSVKLLGQKIYENTSVSGYMVLDSAYLDMLLCYGIVLFVAYMWISVKTIKYLQDQDRYVEMIVIIAYSVYGISETFLTNCFLNMSILLYGEFFKNYINNTKVLRIV